jgi:hypothetical protein
MESSDNLRRSQKFGQSFINNLTLLSNVKKRVEAGPNVCGLSEYLNLRTYFFSVKLQCLLIDSAI